METKPEAHEGLIAVSKKTAWPIWGAAAFILFAALALPMNRVYHFFIYAAIAVAVYFVLDKVIPGYTVYEPAPASVTSTGDAEMDRKILEINDAMKSLAADAVAVSGSHPDTATTLYSIVATMSRIRDDLAEDPKDLRSVRTFLNYYLGTTVKLSGKYVRMDRNGGDGATVKQTMKDLETSFGQIDASLKKILDGLFANDMLDVSTDIAVLNAMLQRDGLEGEVLTSPGGEF